MRRRTALIIGEGIAGPVAAVALRRAGFEARVFEAHPRGSQDVGAFLGLGLNGIAALRVLGLDEPVLARGLPTPRMVIQNGKGRVLADFPNGGTLPDGTTASTIKRPDLYQALREGALRHDVEVQYGKRLVAAHTTGNGVVAEFADGTSAEGDVLVGADGIRSATRRILDPAAPTPRYVGFLNTAGYATGIDLPVEPGVNHLVFGKRSFFGYVKHPDGSIWWFANPPRADEPDPAELAAIPPDQWRAQLLELYAEDTVPAVQAIAATEHIFAGWITYDLPSVPTWHDDRTVLIGDAAHAVSPSAGQGASLAIEDAIVLAKALRDIDDVPTALSTYEALRRPRAERVAAQGRRNGNGKTGGPLARAVRDVVMPLAMRARFRNGRDPMQWIWSHRIDWDEPVTAVRPGPRPVAMGSP